MHTQEEKIMQGHEYQEMGIIKIILEAAYYTKEALDIPPEVDFVCFILVLYHKCAVATLNLYFFPFSFCYHSSSFYFLS